MSRKIYKLLYQKKTMHKYKEPSAHAKEAYAHWFKKYPDHHLEEVPFNKILFNMGWFDNAWANAVPKPHFGNPEMGYEPPRLLYHRDGFYTIYDGRRRIYDKFKDKRSKFWIREMFVTCLVQDEEENSPASGQFVWQVANPLEVVRTPAYKKFWRLLSGHTRFRLVYGKARRSLSVSTQLLLSEIEDVIATLYSDGLVRLYDLQIIADIEEYQDQKKIVLSQQKQLRKYEEYLKRLAVKDIMAGKTEEGLLLRLSQSLDKDIARSKLTEALKKEIIQLKKAIDQQIVVFQQCLELMKPKELGAMPSSEKILELIKAEKEFLKKVTYWSHEGHKFRHYLTDEASS